MKYKTKNKSVKNIKGGASTTEGGASTTDMPNNNGNNGICNQDIAAAVKTNSFVSRLNHLGSMGFPNIQFFSLLAPYALVSFFLFLSLFNLNIKGIMYLIGLIFALLSSNILTIFLPNDVVNDKNKNARCEIFNYKILLHKPILPFGTIVYSYTLLYLLIPMIQNSMMNYAIIIALILMLGIDFIIQTHIECFNFQVAIMSIILTTIITIIWVGYILGTYMPGITYHTDYLSNKEVCLMPSQQKFKCNVYKNGELISSTTK